MPGPLVLCILGLALYPNLILSRSEASDPSRGRPDLGERERRRLRPRGPGRPPTLRGGERAMIAAFAAPHIDYSGLSPVIALTAGICVVLGTAVFDVPRRTAPLLTMLVLAVTGARLILEWNDPQDLLSGALRLDDLAISISLICILTAAIALLLSIGEPATDDAGSGEYHALLLSSVSGWRGSRRRRT